MKYIFRLTIIVPYFIVWFLSLNCRQHEIINNTKWNVRVDTMGDNKHKPSRDMISPVILKPLSVYKNQTNTNDTLILPGYAVMDVENYCPQSFNAYLVSYTDPVNKYQDIKTLDPNDQCKDFSITIDYISQNKPNLGIKMTLIPRKADEWSKWARYYNPKPIINMYRENDLSQSLESLQNYLKSKGYVKTN